ncbi:putative pentafunctional arom [Phaeomoniella chlamydospora]|uniref:Putative pentafunctional arom n=1 Tax=Phaeomoniella chlamydospora TaxID=158046 RepID=A0A0G2EM65_PHACM|nr:putative pentafunctional arom [Phaeomoniella chlamydospora]
MATELQAKLPIVSAAEILGPTKHSAILPFAQTAIKPTTPIAIIFSSEQENLLPLFAEVLGRTSLIVKSFERDFVQERDVVFGVSHNNILQLGRNAKPGALTVINTFCVDGRDTPDENITNFCDYEFLYSRNSFLRRDLTKFLSLILGHSNPHSELDKKRRTTLISTTFPDVRAALSNLDILSVGADAVELRVDLLKEPKADGSFTQIPSAAFVGKQVMLLRSRTELSIIFTTRRKGENGAFPEDDPSLFLKYLELAIKWGVEYIDVEQFLPESIRKYLWDHRGNTRIISAFHDFSGNWSWTSPEARHIFENGAKYSDVVKMNCMAKNLDDNYQLEYFRSSIRASHPEPKLSAVNMGQVGQLSRTLNTVFTPITHPLLPVIAAPGQLSAAEINQALCIMGQVQKRDLYAIGNRFRSTPQSTFFEKCINELGLPHRFLTIGAVPNGHVEGFVLQPSFGGAYLNPPLPASTSFIPEISQSAQAIGHIDTLVVDDSKDHSRLVGENATWRGIRATLTREYVPSAYHNRAAIVISSSEMDAAAAIYALRDLGVGQIFTVGFKATGPQSAGLEPFTSLETVKRVDHPFVIISALSSEKSALVQPLLRHYTANGRTTPRSKGKVFLDLANGPRKNDPIAVAANAGWTGYGIADVSAWITVYQIRLTLGQNVPYDFVRMASGSGLY